MSLQESVTCSLQVGAHDRFVTDTLGTNAFVWRDRVKDVKLDGSPPVLHDEDGYLDDLAFYIAQELSNALVQGICRQKPDGSATVSCPLVSSQTLRKLHLFMTAKSTSNILAKLAVPLKDELLHAGFGAVVVEAPQKLLRLQVQPGGPEQLIDKDAFCIGCLPSCEVQLDINDRTTSRIHICIFNMPGSIIVVDGWSWPGTGLQVGGKRIPRRVTGSIFMVPHGTSAMLHVGKQRVLMNPAEGPKSAMQVPQQE